MTLDNLMKGLMQSAGGSPQGGGGDLLSQALGGMMGSGSQGGSTTDHLLGALEGLIGGRPGSDQPLPQNQGVVPNTGGSNPAMSMVQPVANQVAERAHISPAVATMVAAIAMHYLLASHPSSGRQSPLDFGSVMQQLQSGGVDQSTLQNTGMVNDVKQATGLNQQQAQSGLEAAFKALASHL